MRLMKLVGLAALALLLTACGTRYPYNHQVFRSPELALRSQDDTLALLKSTVTESSLQFPGRALVITPNKDLLAQNGIIARGRHRKNLIDYGSDAYGKDLAAYADFLRIAKVFATVESSISADPKQDATVAAADYDAVVFSLIDAPGVVSWLVLAKGQAVPRLIGAEPQGSGGIAQPNLWTESVARNYQALAPAAVSHFPARKPPLSSAPVSAKAQASYDECMRRIMRIQDAQLRLQSLPMCDGLAK